MTRIQERLMTVGELSRRTGVSIKNVRQYTDWGLIYSAGRSPTGYRLYDADALWCVELIGRLRGLGLTIAEIRDLANTYLKRDERPIGPLLARQLRASRVRVETRLAELESTLRRIDAYETDHRAKLSGRAGHTWADDPRSCPTCA